MSHKNFHRLISAAFFFMLLFHFSFSVTNYVSGYAANYSDPSQVFAGVNVTARHAGTGELLSSSISNATGNFTIVISAPNATPYIVNATPPYMSGGMGPFFITDFVPEMENISVGMFQVGYDVWQEETPGNGSFYGYVKDGNGAAIGDANVSAYSQFGPGSNSSLSNGSGFYNITGLPPRAYSVVACAQGLGCWSFDNMESNNDSREQNFTLSGGGGPPPGAGCGDGANGTLNGTVVDNATAIGIIGVDIGANKFTGGFGGPGGPGEPGGPGGPQDFCNNMTQTGTGGRFAIH